MIGKNFLNIVFLDKRRSQNSAFSCFFSWLKKEKNVFIGALLVNFKRKADKGCSVTIVAAFMRNFAELGRV